MNRTLSMTVLLGVSLLGVLGVGACEEPTEPCDRYVNYMCDCHAEEEGFDCQQLSETLDGADQDVQDQCALDLGDQKDADAEGDVQCDA
jgi:hypothetical protein